MLKIFNKLRVTYSVYPINVSLTRTIVKFPYKARSDWLKQGAQHGMKMVFRFLLRNFETFDPK